MVDQRFNLTQQQAVEAQQALDTSLFNGVVSLAIALRKRDLLTADEVKRMHEMMSKPFVLPHNADNRLVQDAQQNLDGLFAVILDKG